MPQKPNYQLSKLPTKHNPGKNISRVRKNNGLSKKELADKIGITQSLLSKYEVGKLNIPVEIVIQIAITLETDANALLGFGNIKEITPIPKKMIKRIKLIEELPPFDKKTILKMIDTTLKASGLSIE